MMEPIRPSVWRSAKWNTARSVSAVRTAKGEYQGCPGWARLRSPSPDRVIAEPDRQAAALAQGSVMRGHVGASALLLGNVVTAVLVQLERQSGHPGSGEEQASYTNSPPETTERIRATESPRPSLRSANKPRLLSGSGVVIRMALLGRI